MKSTFALLHYLSPKKVSAKRADGRSTIFAAFSRVLLFAPAFLLVSCATTTITPELVQKPVKHYEEVAVGEIKIDGELWHHLLPHFRDGLIKAIENQSAFSDVVYPAPTPLPTNAILVTGHITEIDEGSAAARIIIGFGAGRAKARGTFEIKDSSGTTLAKFQTWEAYSGGMGIGGWSMMSMEELLKQLGEDTGSSVVRWSQGKPLREPSPQE